MTLPVPPRHSLRTAASLLIAAALALMLLQTAAAESPPTHYLRDSAAGPNSSYEELLETAGSNEQSIQKTVAPNGTTEFQRWMGPTHPAGDVYVSGSWRANLTWSLDENNINTVGAVGYIKVEVGKYNETSDTFKSLSGAASQSFGKDNKSSDIPKHTEEFTGNIPDNTFLAADQRLALRVSGVSTDLDKGYLATIYYNTPSELANTSYYVEGGTASLNATDVAPANVTEGKLYRFLALNFTQTSGNWTKIHDMNLTLTGTTDWSDVERVHLIEDRDGDGQIDFEDSIVEEAFPSNSTVTFGGDSSSPVAVTTTPSHQYIVQFKIRGGTDEDLTVGGEITDTNSSHAVDLANSTPSTNATVNTLDPRQGDPASLSMTLDEQFYLGAQSDGAIALDGKMDQSGVFNPVTENGGVNDRWFRDWMTVNATVRVLDSVGNGINGKEIRVWIVNEDGQRVSPSGYDNGSGYASNTWGDYNVTTGEGGLVNVTFKGWKTDPDYGGSYPDTTAQNLFSKLTSGENYFVYVDAYGKHGDQPDDSYDGAARFLAYTFGDSYDWTEKAVNHCEDELVKGYNYHGQGDGRESMGPGRMTDRLPILSDGTSADGDGDAPYCPECHGMSGDSKPWPIGLSDWKENNETYRRQAANHPRSGGLEYNGSKQWADCQDPRCHGYPQEGPASYANQTGDAYNMPFPNNNWGDIDGDGNIDSIPIPGYTDNPYSPGTGGQYIDTDNYWFGNFDPAVPNGTVPYYNKKDTYTDATDYDNTRTYYYGKGAQFCNTTACHAPGTNPDVRSFVDDFVPDGRGMNMQDWESTDNPKGGQPCKLCHTPDFHQAAPVRKIPAYDKDQDYPGDCYRGCHFHQRPHNDEVKCENCHNNFTTAPQHQRALNPKHEIETQGCNYCHGNTSYTTDKTVSGETADPPDILWTNHSQDNLNGTKWNSSTQASQYKTYWNSTHSYSKCSYCHSYFAYMLSEPSDTDRWRRDAAGNVRPGLEFNSSIQDSLWCVGCHVDGVDNATGAVLNESRHPIYQNMSADFEDRADARPLYREKAGSPAVPPEITGNATYRPASPSQNTSQSYVHHTDQGYIDEANVTSDRCLQCHGPAGVDSTDPLRDFVHNTRIGQAGGKFCSQCHEGFDDYRYINMTWQDTEDSYIHQELNNVSNSTTDDRCWGCHGDDADGDNVFNETEQPDGHPANQTTPRLCPDCHMNTDWGSGNTELASALAPLAPQVRQHVNASLQSGSENVENSSRTFDIKLEPGFQANVTTDPEENCTFCHTENGMWSTSAVTADSQYGLTSPQVPSGYPKVSHYGEKRATTSGDAFNTSFYGSTITNCSNCHSNATTTFDLTTRHKTMSPHPGNNGSGSQPIYCTDTACHDDAPVNDGSGDNAGFHSTGLTKPTLTQPNTSYCDNCHSTPTSQKHPDIAGTWNCTDCHLAKKGDIHRPEGSQSYGAAATGEDFGLWPLWQDALNETYPASTTGTRASYDGSGAEFFDSYGDTYVQVDDQTCETCHVGPNQPTGVHLLNLTYQATNTSRHVYYGWDGTGLDCTSCHGSNTDANGKQELHSAHPESYEYGCGCHDGTLASIPQSNQTTGTWNVTVFGLNRTFDASQPQTCDQCHGDWHTNSTYNATRFRSISGNFSWTLKQSATYNSSFDGRVGPNATLTSNTSAGELGGDGCTDCHATDLHEVKYRTADEQRFDDTAGTGCDACHSTNRWNNHQDALSSLYANSSTDAYEACDTCHFEESAFPWYYNR